MPRIVKDVTAVGATSEAFWEAATQQVANYARLPVEDVRIGLRAGLAIPLELSPEQFSQAVLCGVCFKEQRVQYEDGRVLPLQTQRGIQTKQGEPCQAANARVDPWVRAARAEQGSYPFVVAYHAAEGRRGLAGVWAPNVDAAVEKARGLCGHPTAFEVTRVTPG